MDPKPYLDYLDKEMTIMGVLSAFCAALAGLAVNQVAAADKGGLKQVWDSGSGLVVAGSVGALVASLCFYRQRSLLAWYFGQIALAQSLEEQPDPKVGDLLADADGWDTWIDHQRGFAYLAFAFVPYLLAFVKAARPGLQGNFAAIVTVAAFVLVLGIVERRAYVFRRYSDREDPWSSEGAAMNVQDESGPPETPEPESSMGDNRGETEKGKRSSPAKKGNQQNPARKRKRGFLNEARAAIIVACIGAAVSIYQTWKATQARDEVRARAYGQVLSSLAAVEAEINGNKLEGHWQDVLTWSTLALPVASKKVGDCLAPNGKSSVWAVAKSEYDKRSANDSGEAQARSEFERMKQTIEAAIREERD